MAEPARRPALERISTPAAQETATDRQAHEPVESAHPGVHMEPAAAIPTVNREAAPTTAHQPAEAVPVSRPASSEVILEPVNRESSGPVREISMRIGDQAQDSAHLRVVERGGEVLVSVRSGSEQLARTLSSDLGELAHRLEQSGFQAELWRPVTQSSSSGATRDHRENASTAGQNQDALPGDRKNSQDQSGRNARELWDELDETLSQ